MLRYADDIGWAYVASEAALQWRGGEDKLFFTDVLRSQLLRLNPGVVDAEVILRQLTLLRSTIEDKSTISP